MDPSTHPEFFESASRSPIHAFLDFVKGGSLGQSAEALFLIGQLERLATGQALDPSQSQRCRTLIQNLEQSPHFSTNPSFVQICIQTRHWLASGESRLLNSMQSSLSPGSALLNSSSGSGERASLDIGEKIDRYTILDKLGQGGMGAVFLCFDEIADRKVAIKVLLEVKNQKHVSAMLDEAKAAASLTHRNCVGIHDLKRETNIGSPAIVLEYVPGVDGAGFLSHEIFERCERHFLTPLSALLILEQMVAGLRAAHQLGMVHQDIKPENFLFEQTVIDQLIDEEDAIGILTPESIEEILLQNRQRPWVKLSDLGMALSKEKKDSDMGLSLSVSFGLSQIPEYKRGGTYVYMPPEQMDGVGISRVTDVFALGLVFYTLLTGQDARIARKHAEDLEDFHYDSVQTFLVAIASSKAKAAISAKKDPNLKKLGLKAELLSLLEQMAARDKKKRINSSTLATRVEELIEIEYENAASPKRIIALVGVVLLFFIPALVLVFGDWNTGSTDLEDDNSVAKSDLKIEHPKKVDPPVKELKSNEVIWQEIRSNNIANYSDMRATSPGILQRLVDKAPSKLVLNRLEMLTREDALILAHFSGDIELKKASRLSDEVLEILAFSRAFIQLDSRYQSIFEDLKKKANLIQSEAKLGNIESLKELKILHADIAQALNELGLKELRLPGLLALNPKAADLLKHISGRIDLSGLNSINGPTALSLSQVSAKYLSLSGLTSIDEEVARALSDYGGRLLYLNSLKTLTPETAMALSETSAHLRLLGLKTISPEVAKGFANHKGVTSFGGLITLNVEVAKAFVARTGYGLSLSGLSTINPEIAKLLASAKLQHLNLGINSIDKEVAKELSAFSGSHLGLNLVTVLNYETASLLGQFKGSILGLNGLAKLDKEVAAGLKSFKGEIALARIKTLPFRAMDSLIGFAGQLDVPYLRTVTVPTLMGMLVHRIRLKEIPKSLQSAFAGYASKLTRQKEIEKKLLGGKPDKLRELTTLAPEVARYLVKSGPTVMNFSMLRYLSEDAAQIISAHKGLLNFGGIEELGFGAAQGFKKFKGNLVLTNLRDLDADVALALADRKAVGLDLRGVTALKPGVSVALSKSVGLLNLSGLTSLKVEDAKNLAKQKGRLGFRGLNPLTLEVAKELVKHGGDSLSLGLIDNKNRDLIKVLSQYKGGLNFDRTKTLTTEFAEEIEPHEGLLRLLQLKSLDSKLIPILAKHRGPVVLPAKSQSSLNELRTAPAKAFQKFVLENSASYARYLCFLTEELAEHVVKNNAGELSLDFLQELTPKVAEILLKQQDHLSFPQLNQLSVETARVLARNGRKDLKFGALEKCSLPALSELVKHKGWLCLDGRKTFSGAEGKCLGQHKGGLRLSALDSMSPEAAAGLANHAGTLRVLSLEGFSDDALKALSAHKGRLYYDGRTQPSLRVAKGLRDHKGILSFGSLAKMSPEIVTEFAKKADGSLWFGGFRKLPVNFAKAVAAREKASLFFNSVRRLSLDSNREIVKAKCDWLVFDGLSTLSAEQARLFASFPKHLRFYGMRSFSVEAATALSKHKGVIRIGRVHKFPQETAKAFLAHGGVRIHFHYLKTLTVEFAKLLAQYKGGIGLDDMRELSLKSARELVKHKGPYIWMTRVKTLSPELATILSTYSGSLSLHGLEDISDEVAKILAKRVSKTYSNDATLKKINSFKPKK